MPGYRDDYPRRRPQHIPERGGCNPYGPPQRRYDDMPRRRYHDDMPPRRAHGGDPYSRYNDERRPERPMRGEYYNQPEIPRSRDRLMNEDYIGRQMPRRSSGEYLADLSDDRYYVPEEKETDNVFVDSTIISGKAMENVSDTREDPNGYSLSDDFDDFDADFEEVDQWYSSHNRESVASEAYNADNSSRRSPQGWSRGNGFDGFEDDEDIARAVGYSGHRNDGWFENDATFANNDFYPESDFGKRKKKSGKGIIIGCLCGVLSLAVIGALVILFSNDSGVPMNLDSILDTINSEQTETLIGAFVNKKISEAECNVSVDGKSTVFKLSDCEITYAGKDGKHTSEYITGTDEKTGKVELTEYAYSGVFRYNRTALRELLESQLDSNSNPVSDPYFVIDYENSLMTIYAGTDGWGVNVDTFLSQLTSALAGSGIGNVKIVCSSGAVPARPMSADDIYEQAVTEPKDAYTTTDSAGNTIYHSEINGVSFDKGELERLLAAGGSEMQLPVKVTHPAIDLREIKKYTFPDVLATYYTYYSVELRERSHNLALAAEKINSMILEPGEQFSFNGRVGERTKANGFKIAGVYAGEGNAEDYGGGICQTSSTLYYTCILANLQIDDRTNHIYTVGYMQTADTRRTVYGNDATVNWGLTDYKFTNNKAYPIRIDIKAKDGILTCEIRGTADGMTADFEYETVFRNPYKIKYLRDNGSNTQAGHDGYTVNVYRIVYKDGKEIDRRLESKNNYLPMNKVYYTNDLPAGYEYGKEYPQDYVPTTTEPTTTTTTTAPPIEDTDAVG